MSAFFASLFSFFLTWWGVVLLAWLDNSVLFFLPFGVDALVIYLSARHGDWFWVYPLLATMGSMAGAAGTFWIGKWIGEAELDRFVPARRLDRIRRTVREGGAVAMAIPALLPPPFPLTPFILTCGALSMDATRFLVTFSIVRLIRFGSEGVLAHIYGDRVLQVLKSDMFQAVVIGFIGIAIAGTIISGIVLWRHSREPRGRGRANTATDG